MKNQKGLGLIVVLLILGTIFLTAGGVVVWQKRSPSALNPNHTSVTPSTQISPIPTQKILSSDLKVYLGPTPFDPLVGGPKLPTNLTTTPSPGLNYWLVQLTGPVLSEWREELIAQGLRIVNYVPDFTYIGRMDSAARKRIEKLSFVRWIGLYQPEYKISPDLLKTSGKVEVTIGLFPDESVDPILDQLSVWGIKPEDFSASPSSPVIRVALDASQISQIAQIAGVAWIVPYVQPNF